MANTAEEAVVRKCVRVKAPIEWALSVFVEQMLERHGEGYQQLRELLDGPGAWGAILALYGRAVDGAERQEGQ